MSRQQDHQKLAKKMFELASTEESAELIAQWTILGKRYLEISKTGTELYREQLAGTARRPLTLRG